MERKTRIPWEKEYSVIKNNVRNLTFQRELT